MQPHLGAQNVLNGVTRLRGHAREMLVVLQPRRGNWFSFHNLLLQNNDFRRALRFRRAFYMRTKTVLSDTYAGNRHAQATIQ